MSNSSIFVDKSKMGAFKLAVAACLVVLLEIAAHLVICQVTEEPFVLIEEPAFLVVIPNQPVHLSGGRISMTCVAFGAPFPDIVWSSASQEITDYRNEDDPTINIYSFNLTDPTTGFILHASVLELCDATYNASLITDYRCTTVNALSETGRPRCGKNTTVFDIRPMIQEPSVLIVAPTQNSFQYQGNRMSVTCAAYGSPRPRVWISSEPLGISDFSLVDNPTVNVYTEDIDTGDNVFVQTTLEVCANQNDLETYRRYVTGMECNTENGIEVDPTNAVGVQIIGFRPQPFSRLTNYNLSIQVKYVQMTVSYESTVTTFNPNRFGCSFRSFSFSNSATNPSMTFTPRYPGSCDVISDTETIYTMDNRDYRDYIDENFASNSASQNVYLYTTEEESFAPPITLEPITSSNALNVRNYAFFTDSDVNPDLTTFDVYLTSSEILLFVHFDAIISTSTFQTDFIMLTDGRSSGTRYGLSGASLNNDGSHVKTACVRVRPEDRLVLGSQEICTSSNNCFLYIPQDAYVRSHTSLSISNAIPQNAARQSRYFWIPPQLGPVYLQLRVQFIGCTLDLSLGRNQPYRILDTVDETVTSRVTCHGNTATDINPKLYYNGGAIEESYLTRHWPSMITFESPDGVVTTDQLGLLTCTTYENTANISHLVHTGDPSLLLLTGGEYMVKLLERIVIRFTYFTSAADPNIFTISDLANNPPPFEAIINTTYAPFVAELVIEDALFGMTGSYQILASSRPLAQFSIVVNPPTLDASPAAIALMFSNSMVTLTCTSINQNIPIHWTRSDDPTRILSNSNTYHVILSAADMTRLEGGAYFCSVFDPEGSMNTANGTLAAQKRVPIRKVNDSLSVYTESDSIRRQVLNNDIIVVTDRFSEPTYLECFGQVGSGVADLYWTIAREGEEPLVTDEEISDDQYTITLGDNFITIRISNSVKPFRGVIRCNSQTVNQRISIFVRANEFSFSVCPENLDFVWGLTWPVTEVGLKDGQPCPMISSNQVTGTATRMCMEGGVWSDVDISECCLATFANVNQEAAQFAEDEAFLDNINHASRVNKLSMVLRDAIEPGTESLFPTDIQTSTDIVSSLITATRNRRPPTIHSLTVDIFDRLLNENNTGGWTYLQQMGDRSSITLLSNAENYGEYLYESLTDPAIQPNSNNMITYLRSNVAFTIKNIPAILSDEIFMFGEVSSGSVRLLYSEDLLRHQLAQGVIHIGFKNLNTFIPRDQPNFNNNRTTFIVSLLVSTQVISAGFFPLFPENSPLELEFVTLRTSRASNPRVVFWDSFSSQWSEDGVNSSFTVVNNGEFQVFNVRGKSLHLTAFGVAVDVSQNNDIDCGSLTAPTNGMVFFTTTTFGSTASYSCGTGYTLNGPERRTCGADGNWTLPTEPSCLISNSCLAAVDSVWGIGWPSTERDSESTQNCPPHLGHTITGQATRTCGSDGEWNCPSVLECQDKTLTDILAEVSNSSIEELVEHAVNFTMQLADITMPDDFPLLPSSLNVTNQILTLIVSALEKKGRSNTTGATELIVEVLNNLLELNNLQGWIDLQASNPGSQVLLDNAERVGILLTYSVKADDTDQLIRISRPNIAISASLSNEIDEEDLTFPEKEDLVNFTTSIPMPGKIQIPYRFLLERLSQQNSTALPIVFIIFQNLASFLPISAKTFNTDTRGPAVVISAQVGESRSIRNSEILKYYPITLNFTFNEINNTKDFHCVFWNSSEPIGYGGWSSEGVTTIGNFSTNFTTTVECSSTHLTSFSVLVTLVEINNASDIDVALNFVSNIGCIISILCLVATIIFFLFEGKNLLSHVHYLVHLNLSISLLLAYLVFVAGVDTAANNRIGCAFVTVLLHYLFLAVFSWMLCEGIMLYLMLVVVFGQLAKKWWLFLLLGYSLPIPFVGITVAIRWEYYGVTDMGTQFCWLTTKDWTIFGFVAPMLAIILINVVFLGFTLRILWKNRKSAIMRTTGQDKDNKHLLHVQLVKSVLLAVVVLLPLLGLTWVFGLLTINRNTTIFAWIFTILNSLQGLAIFFFHVLRSDKIRGKINKECLTLWCRKCFHLSGPAVDKPKTVSRMPFSNNSSSIQRQALGSTENDTLAKEATLQLSENSRDLTEVEDQEIQGGLIVVNLAVFENASHSNKSNSQESVEYASTSPTVLNVTKYCDV